MRLHILKFIECTKESQLGRGVLFSLGERTAVSRSPHCHGLIPQKNADSISQLAIRSNIENKFRRRSLGIVGKRRTLPHKVVLINVPLSAGVGLQAANGLIGVHADIMTP